MSAKLERIKNQIAKLEAERDREAENYSKKQFKQLFKDHKDLECFSWVQYTPYWNDGDTCTFSVYNEEIDINDEENVSTYGVGSVLEKTKDKRSFNKAMKDIDKRIEEYKKNKWDFKYLEVEKKELTGIFECEDARSKLEAKYEMISGIQAVLNDIPEESYLSMFGDHAKVVVTPQGIEVESYNHD